MKYDVLQSTSTSSYAHKNSLTGVFCMEYKENSHMESGKRVRQVREELNARRFSDFIPDEKSQKRKVSQESFAAILDCPLDTLRSIEQGRRPLSVKLAKKISEIAEHPAPAAWLMGETAFRNEAEERMAEARESIAAAKQVVSDMEQKDESFAAFMILLDDAVKESGAMLYARERKGDPYDSIPQAVKDNMPLHTATVLYEYILKQGSKTATFGSIDLKRLQKRITRYTKMLIEEMIEEGGTDDGEQ